MTYLVSRLTGLSSIQLNTQDLRERVEDVEQLDYCTWKLWVLTEILGGEDCRVYSLNGKWKQAKRVAKASAAYLRVEQKGDFTTVTVLSRDDACLSNMLSVVNSLYDTLEPVTVDTVLENNRDVIVRSAEIVDEDAGVRVYSEYTGPMTFKKLLQRPRHLNKRGRYDIASVSIVPDWPFPVTVETIDVSIENAQVAFDLGNEHDLQRDENSLAKVLFDVTHRAFTGKAVAPSTAQSPSGIVAEQYAAASA